LHLEFRENSLYLLENPLPVAGDVLVLAGDVLLFWKNKLLQHPFFDWCADNFRQTYIIPGNHEYYDGAELSQTLTDFEYLLRPNVRYLNNKSIRIDDTELFFTTLWCVIDIAQLVPVQTGVSDCHRIIFNDRRFTSYDYAVVHRQCFSWLKKALELSTAACQVVVTHHCPTERFLDPRFVGSAINSAFVVKLDDFIERSNADYWIYGHTHFNSKPAMIGQTKMVCNQLGYVKHQEQHDFMPAAAICLSTLRQ